MGASTGGVEALKEVLTNLPATLPPIVITQHMPPLFTKSFADRLNKSCAINICEAEDGATLKNGHAYIAKGGLHMLVKGNTIKLQDGEAVSSHKPSVDVLFESIAAADGKHTLGIILTGMGKDGAKGMLALKQAGAFTIGQDEASSLVYGMPKAAFLSGGIDVQLPLNTIAKAITHIVGK
jgi:two-component system chemotaxis response regulator CheB